MSKITNKHRLPIPLVALVSRPFYWQEGRIGATTLIMPPRVHQLRIRHDDEVTEDAADKIWLLLGTKIHKDLEQAGKNLLDKTWNWITTKMREYLTGMLVEKKYTIEVGGWTIVCVGDVYTPKIEELSDYKITSVWSVIDRIAKEEWVQQLNINSYIYQQHGHGVKRLVVTAILRDWSVGLAQQRGNYPPVGVRTVSIPIWGNNTTRLFIEDRIRMHQEAAKLPDNELPLCTPKERFRDPDKWAARKKANKKATKLFLREEECTDWIDAQKDKKLFVAPEYRPSEDKRCKLYCNVAPFCSYAKKMGY